MLSVIFCRQTRAARICNQPPIVTIAVSRRPVANMTLSNLLSRTVSKVGSRSMFTASKPDTVHPNWLRVGLSFGTAAFLWGLLFKQHSTDVNEYKVRNGLE